MQANYVEKSFCTTREAATVLGVSVGTVQLWVENGLLKAWKTTGGHRRVSRDSVGALLNQHKSPDIYSTAPSKAIEATHSVASPVMRRMQILVVDDDAQLLRLYQANLSRWFMQPNVVVSSEAVEALIMIGRSQPDLLIADLHMPGMDGFKLLRVLRSKPELDRTTIVVVSGLDAADIQARGGIPAGIELLPKPIPFDRLLDIAKHIVEKQHLERRAAP